MTVQFMAPLRLLYLDVELLYLELSIEFLDVETFSGSDLRVTASDSIDRIRADWAEQRPDLDSTGFALAGRILVLARHLERRVEAALAPFGLSGWAFDVLFFRILTALVPGDRRGITANGTPRGGTGNRLSR